MGERIFEIERVSDEELVFRFKMKKLGLVPTVPGEHLRVAGRELLLAARSLIDGGIECLEPKKDEKGSERTKIEVK